MITRFDPKPPGTAPARRQRRAVAATAAALLVAAGAVLWAAGRGADPPSQHSRSPQPGQSAAPFTGPPPRPPLRIKRTPTHRASPIR